MAESQLAKKVAIGLGTVEFLSGLVAAAVMFISAVWVAADPAIADQTFFWPVLIGVMLTLAFGPPLVAYLAERAKTGRTVYICLALLIAYPVLLFGWVNLRGA